MTYQFKLIILFCFIALCSGLNSTELELIKSSFHFNENAFTFNRIMANISLKNIFPTLPQNYTYELEFDRSKSLPELKYSLINEGNEIYFLTSFRRPTNLKINLIFSTYLLDEFKFEKEVTVNYDVKELGYTVNYIFEFTVLNTTLSDLLKSEFKILNYFRNNLWRRQLLFVNVDNSNLDITYIKPASDQSNSFVIGIGSDYGLPETLSYLIQLKNENPSGCFSIKNEDLDKFKKATGLSVNLCSINFQRIDHNELKDQSDFSIHVYYNLQIDDPSKSSTKTSIILASVSISVLILVVLLFGSYKFIKKYSTSLAYQKAST